MADIIQRVIDASARGDLYAALGVAPLPQQGDSAVDALRRCTVLKDLPVASIKSAYVSMSLACHPDKCKHEKATDAQTAVNKAWEVLRVSASRTAYDSSFRAMIQRENEARQREEIRKQKQTQPAITPKMFQQQSVKIIQRLARKQMQRAVRKVNKMLRLRLRIQPNQAARKRLIPKKRVDHKQPGM
jgi:DnaJ-class molecular chaperone